MSDQANDLASQASDAIRTLIHLTRGDHGLENPGDVTDIIAGLQTMAAQLPQLLAQLAA
jgi:hypothetical protein